MEAAEIPGFQTMSLSEKLFLLEDLWSHISSKEEELSVRKGHQIELDQRFNRQYADEELLSLEELKTQIDKSK